MLTAKVRYRTMSYEYARFSKEMGLPQERERVRVSGDFVPKVGAKRGIIKEKSKKSTETAVLIIHVLLTCFLNM